MDKVETMHYLIGTTNASYHKLRTNLQENGVLGFIGNERRKNILLDLGTVVGDKNLEGLVDIEESTDKYFEFVQDNYGYIRESEVNMLNNVLTTLQHYFNHIHHFNWTGKRSLDDYRDIFAEYRDNLENDIANSIIIEDEEIDMLIEQTERYERILEKDSLFSRFSNWFFRKK